MPNYTHREGSSPEASIQLTAHPDYPDVLLSDVFVAPGASLLDVADALLDIAAELERRGGGR